MIRTPTAHPSAIGNADIVLVVPNLRLGGAQRQAVNITASLAADGFRTALLTTLGPHATWYSPDTAVDWFDATSVTAARPRRPPRRRAAYIGRKLISAGIGPGARGLARRVWDGRSGLALLRAVAGERGELLGYLMQKHPPKRVLSMPTRTNVMTAGAVWDLPTRFVPSFREDHGSVAANEPWTSLEALAFRRAEIVTANSVESVESIRRSGFPQVALLPNIVTSNPAPSSEHQSRFVISSRLTPVKGVDLAIDAFSRVADRLPNWTLEVFGDGPSRADLERLAERTGLTGRIAIFSASDPINHLGDGGIFLMPSRHAEGTPNARLEALNFGLPVVIWDDVPGTKNLVRTGESGVRVVPEDVSAFAEAMLELASSRQQRATLSEGARHAVDGHRWAQCRSTYLDVLGLR